MTEKRKTRRGGRPAPGEKEQMRGEILEAASRAIAADGYWGMSMRDLARATGRGLASFYNYFDSKEDVLFALQSGAFGALISTSESALGAGRTPEGRLHAFILNHVRYVSEHQHVMQVLVHEAAALPPGRRRAVRALKERYFEIGRSIVRDIMSAKHPRVRDVEVERASYALFGMINWVWGWYEPGRHGSPEDVARTFHRLALRGLAESSPFKEMQADVERRLGHGERLPLIRQHTPAHGGT